MIDQEEDLKDSSIDRLHYLAEMGDYLNACAVYEEFRETMTMSNWQKPKYVILCYDPIPKVSGFTLWESDVTIRAVESALWEKGVPPFYTDVEFNRF